MIKPNFPKPMFIGTPVPAGDIPNLESGTKPVLEFSAPKGTVNLAEGKTVTSSDPAPIIGDLTHSRVFRSNVITLATLGARVTVVAPPTLMPAGIGAWAERDGFATSWDLDAVLADDTPDAVMMLRVQRERMSGGYFPTAREYTVGYGLTRPRLALLLDRKPEAVVMHPGPMNRGLEISADAAESGASIILDQVSGGLAVRMAVLYHLLAGEEISV